MWDRSFGRDWTVYDGNNADRLSEYHENARMIAEVMTVDE